MERIALKNARFARRNRRVRKNIDGSAERLRLTVYRSSSHIYAQIIDDTTSQTVVAASTIDKEVRAKISANTPKSERSKIVGEVLAQRAKEANVSTVAFDRNGFLFHGRIKALADAARAGGLNF